MAESSLLFAAGSLDGNTSFAESSLLFAAGSLDVNPCSWCRGDGTKTRPKVASTAESLPLFTAGPLDVNIC
eukprot:12931621-Prorocentrum_lima.AAC.1